MEKWTLFLTISLLIFSCRDRGNENAELSGLRRSKPTIATKKVLSPCDMQKAVWQKLTAEDQIWPKPLPRMSRDYEIAINMPKDPAIASETFRKLDENYDGEELRFEGLRKKRRIKIIHNRGSVATISWVPIKGAEHPYTGLFKTGAPCGLTRLALAIQPTKENYIPGAAFKFYIPHKILPNGVFTEKSVNLVVMNKLEGQKSRNYFENPFSNVVPPADHIATKTGTKYFEFVMKRLKAADHRINILELDHVASVGVSGKPKIPGRITFVPTNKVQSYFKDNPPEDPRPIFEKIPSGTTLYNIYVAADQIPNKKPLGTLIGKIVTTSEFVNSKYGDEVLHFKHYKRMRK